MSGMKCAKCGKQIVASKVAATGAIQWGHLFQQDADVCGEAVGPQIAAPEHCTRDVEIALLRAQIRTMHLTYGRDDLVARAVELQAQSQQYVEHAQERERHFHAIEARCSAKCPEKTNEGGGFACSPQESTCSGVESAGETTELLGTTVRRCRCGQLVAVPSNHVCGAGVQMTAEDALRDARPPKEPKRYTLSEINPGWRCPDCDGTEVISSGPQRFICDRCFLTAKLDTAEARTVSLEAQLAEAKLVRNGADSARMREAANVLKLLARSAPLEAQLATLQREHAPCLANYERKCQQLATADERNGKLVEALTRYGQHAENCAERLPSKEPHPKCDCGFTDAKECKC